MQIIYDIFVSLMAFGLKVFSFFNEKARKGVLGRKESFAKINALKGKKVIWMHAASLGEYEQGLPVLEKLKNHYPNHKILVSFFSPSGYENVVKKQNIADVVCYLPFDFKTDIQKFIKGFETKIFFTVKYDYWYHLFAELKQKGAKIFVVSALFYEKQIFFKPYGKWFANQLKINVDWFFHQTCHSEFLARKIGLVKSSTSGDTRFDRVRQIRDRDNFVPMIEDFKEGQSLVVFGSSWEAEEKIAKILAEKSSVKIIIAPHDLKRIENLKQIFPNTLMYSQLNDNSDFSQSVLLIDSIGLLSKIYSYGTIAVVGGGFHSAGLHNILEAVTFGVPVVFGNQYKKNPEADALIAQNGGKSFATEKDAAEFLLELLKNKILLSKMSENARDFVTNQPMATEEIVKKITNC